MGTRTKRPHMVTEGYLKRTSPQSRALRYSATITSASRIRSPPLVNDSA